MAPKESGGKGSASPGQSPEETTYTGKADNYVPAFSGRQADYREFRKRCDIYSAKMKIAKRQSETVFNIVTLLSGRAWDVVEDLTVEELSATDAYDKVFGRLDATFKYEPITELPSDFESFFIGLQRRGGQTVSGVSDRVHASGKASYKHPQDPTSRESSCLVVPQALRSFKGTETVGLNTAGRKQSDVRSDDEGHEFHHWARHEAGSYTIALVEVFVQGLSACCPG